MITSLNYVIGILTGILSIQDVTNEMALATTALVGITASVLGLCFLIGNMLKSVYIFAEWQKLGQALQMNAIKGLLYVGLWGPIGVIIAWIIHLLTIAGK